MSDIAISVSHVGKDYSIGLATQKSDTLLGSIANTIKAPIRNYRELKNLSTFNGEERKDVFHALTDITFDVKEGEAVAIIGHNGAGKSTLLKIISRITDPSSGIINIYGRVSSLLEVGTGFHPDLTGRENIYLNGTILGMRKQEIDKKFDEILDFAGIEKYIDTPVKRYSSGMRVRLAFSVAAHLEAEILLIDEVLAVGDAEFQKKCLGKMNEVATAGRTVLFVSHNMGAIKELCTRGIVLNKGHKVFDGNVKDSIMYYMEALAFKTDPLKDKDPLYNSILLGDLYINDSLDAKITAGTPIKVTLPVKANMVENPRIKFILEDFMGNYLAYLDIHSENIGYKTIDGENSVEINFPPLWLAPGIYATHFRIFTDTQNRILTNKTFFEVVSDPALDQSGFFSGGSEKNTILSPLAEWSIIKS